MWNKEVGLKDFDAEKLSERVQKAGKTSYVERNREMINDSDVCVFFYRESYTPMSNSRKKSGTKLAFDYAVKQGKRSINVAKLPT